MDNECAVLVEKEAYAESIVSYEDNDTALRRNMSVSRIDHFGLTESRSVGFQPGKVLGCRAMALYDDRVEGQSIRGGVEHSGSDAEGTMRTSSQASRL